MRSLKDIERDREAFNERFERDHALIRRVFFALLIFWALFFSVVILGCLLGWFHTPVVLVVG